MLKSIWYLFKILVVVGAAVFLAVQPGTIQITWKEYTIRDLHLGAAALALFLVLLCVVFLSGILYRLMALPREVARLHRERRRTKGYKALVQSLTAAAADDHKAAYSLANRAQKLLPENESGIPLLLKAHAAKSRGQIDETDLAFRQLLGNADTALLGVHGLMQKAMIQGDYAQALKLARESRASMPRNAALIKPVYDLEIRNRLWPDALQTLETAVSRKVVSKAEAAQDKTALYCLLGDQAKVSGANHAAHGFYKKAYESAPEFAPAVDRFARSLMEQGHRLRALEVVKKAWKANPHPDMLPLWDMLVPQVEKDRSQTRYRWFEWVQELQPDKDFAVLAMAKVAIEEGLWGEARAALMKAEKISPSVQLYRLWVMLEERTGNKLDVIRQWMDRAASAPAPKSWTCQKTGRHFDNWVAVVEPEGFFNTVAWGERFYTGTPQNDPSRWLLDRSAA